MQPNLVNDFQQNWRGQESSSHSSIALHAHRMSFICRFDASPFRTPMGESIP